MHTHEIGIGDVVRFKSGRTKVNVNDFQAGFVNCVWQNADGTFQQCNVKSEVLVKVESAKDGILEDIDELFPQHPINHD